TSGLAENTNKSIRRALWKLVDDTGSNWDEFFGDILFSLLSKPNTTTKMSPFQLLYGFEATFPDQVSENYMSQQILRNSMNFYKEYIRNMESRHAADIELALTNISKAQEKQQIQYAKTKTCKHWKITFEVGDSVMLLNARRKTRKGGPLQPTHCGPYKVTAVEDKRVKLETISGKLLGSMYSISHLKLFKEPPTLAAENRLQENMEMETAVDNTIKKSPQKR
ncbi:hypothetical protein G0U57_018034, partial [Chelydra serpentina]